MKSIIFIFLLLIVICMSCLKDKALQIQPSENEILQKYLTIPSTPFNYASPSLPSYFNNQFVTIQNNKPATNKTTDWGATLGRVLFYDTRLSKNYKISCASCHKQEFGFTDTAVLSTGFNGGFTKRHSMSLINATYYIDGRFFWDERAASLEVQVLKPIQDAVEMGMTLDSLVYRIRKLPFYPILFNKAFGSTTINSSTISKALAQYVRSIISYQSKYDEGRKVTANRNTDFPNFTTQENEGKTIFMTNKNINCFSCHNTDVFITDNPRNNGLTFDNNDEGIFIHTHTQMKIKENLKHPL